MELKQGSILAYTYELVSEIRNVNKEMKAFHNIIKTDIKQQEAYSPTPKSQNRKKKKTQRETLANRIGKSVLMALLNVVRSTSV